MNRFLRNQHEAKFLKVSIKVFSAQSFFALSLLLIGIITARLLGPKVEAHIVCSCACWLWYQFFNLGIGQSNTYYFAKIKKVNCSLIAFLLVS